MKRIVIITSYFDSIFKFRLPLIRRLIRCGYSVSVFAPLPAACDLTKLNTAGVSFYNVPFERSSVSPLVDFKCFITIVSLLLRIKPQCVLTYFVKPNVWGILGAALVGVPRRVALVEGMGYSFTRDKNGRIPPKKRIISIILTFLYSFSFRFANRVIVLNPDDMNLLKRLTLIPLSRFCMLNGIGVDVQSLVPSLERPRCICFTMVARLLVEKGVLEYIAAANLLSLEFPSAKFVLLGDVDENPGSLSLERIRSENVNNAVLLPGHVDIQPWMHNTSVFVLPSYREGHPVSTQEALAYGLPIITTDVPGCRETVVDGFNGFKVPPRDVQMLADAMRKFMSNPRLICFMGVNSRAIALSKYDQRKSCHVLFDLILS